ncbi:GSCOCG00006941001-RA-CDS [Cotesia congregata]|nr:GSCOCG00006941001-RA-CDS [Cotesia congregata]
MYVPVLFKVVLPLEGLSADLAGEGHVVLMTALVYHEVVGLSESPLAVLADELDGALGAHLLPAAELPAVPLCLHRHYREHPYKFPPLPRFYRLNILRLWWLSSSSRHKSRLLSLSLWMSMYLCM